MRKLPLPIDDAGEVYRTCIGRVRNPDLHARLATLEGAIVAASEDYADAGGRNAFHTLDQQPQGVGTVTADELSDVYLLRMAKKGQPGRPVYDRLLVLGCCPLCAQRQVSTLDHYLPHTRYPTLAVAPANLVPACSDCNKAKLDHCPTCAADQTLHPYFDDCEDRPWLFADVVQTNPVSLLFSVRPPATWPALMQDRTRFHFKKLNLAPLYASHAADETAGIRHSMINLFERAGVDEVRAWLRDSFESRSAVHVNSWQAATYRALLASDWYCAGGFR